MDGITPFEYDFLRIDLIFFEFNFSQIHRYTHFLCTNRKQIDWQQKIKMLIFQSIPADCSLLYAKGTNKHKQLGILSVFHI